MDTLQTAEGHDQQLHERLLRPVDAVLTYTALSVIAVGWLYFRGGELQDWFPVSFRRNLWAALVGCGVGLVMVLASHAASVLSQRYRDLVDFIAPLVGHQSRLGILLLAVFSSVGEECFFRGALQPHLGLIATSLVFGVLHGFPGTKLGLWGLFAFVAGICFGGLAEVFGNLWAPTIAHGVVNFINLHMLIRSRRPLNAEVSPRVSCIEPGETDPETDSTSRNI